MGIKATFILNMLGIYTRVPGPPRPSHRPWYRAIRLTGHTETWHCRTTKKILVFWRRLPALHETLDQVGVVSQMNCPVGPGKQTSQLWNVVKYIPAFVLASPQ